MTQQTELLAREDKGTRQQLEPITITNIVGGKLVRSLAWRTRSHEGPDQRAARLLAMRARMARAIASDPERAR